MNNIFIAAHARSGSTFLCRLMERINEIRVYLEIFHFFYDVIDQHLGGDLSVIEQKMHLPANKKKARRELVSRYSEYVGLLQEINPGKVIAFKVFPNHLPDKLLGDVIRDSRLILMLRRNLLHSHISNVISMKTQKWGGVDTSQEKIKFCQDDFAGHVRSVMKFYRNVLSLAKEGRKELVEIDYEALTMSGNPGQLVSSLLSEGLGFAVEANDRKLKIARQDKRTMATDKVLNAGEMMDYLEACDLQILNDGLANCVDSDYTRIAAGTAA